MSAPRQRKLTRGGTLPPISTEYSYEPIAIAQAEEPQPWISPRTTALTLLILQNASVSLLTRLSRTPAPGQAVYAPSVAVFTAEIMKFTVSLSMLVRERRAQERKKDGRLPGRVEVARDALVDLFENQRGEIVKLAVPAALYALQNTLLYIALTNLDAATYQTTYQLKLLTAALFSVIFFRRSLSLVKWFSLLLLVIGVAIVQLSGVRNPSAPSADSLNTNQNPQVGLAAILAACVSSGLAGGWFEYVLKGPAPPPPTPMSAVATSTPGGHIASPDPASPMSATSTSSTSTSKSSPLKLRPNSPSLWARNLQLSVSSLTFSASGIFLCPEWPLLKQNGVWQGFSLLVWSVVVNQALGGLLVAAVVRQADSVAKGFATSIAIVLSTLASVVFFGLAPGWNFLVGAALVMGSTILYATDKSD